jgi:hypothetical protein
MYGMQQKRILKGKSCCFVSIVPQVRRKVKIKSESSETQSTKIKKSIEHQKNLIKNIRS